MTQITLGNELAFYKKNKQEYLQKYANKHVLIKGEELIGIFDTGEMAYKAGVDKFGNEPFLIKQVLEQEPTLTISSLYVGISHASI